MATAVGIVMAPTASIFEPLSHDAITAPPAEEVHGDERRDGQIDIWVAIQEAKKNAPPEPGPAYVHPLLKRSASFLSQKSLEVCTESLGSETGSDGFSDPLASLSASDDDSDGEQETLEEVDGAPAPPAPRRELAAVNYHCSSGKRSPPRSFPPPLPSISRRDGPCLHMKPRRHDGRLVMHAVPVPSQNYLHCERQAGRLLLSFIETAFEEIYPDQSPPAHEQQEEDTPPETEGEEEEEEYEEDEVMDRQSPPRSGSGGGKAHESSVAINKFVGGTPAAGCSAHDDRRPLFIWKPACIATS